MNILFRADSSSTIGTGHIMRDLVLAKQFEDANVIFAVQDLPGNINHKIEEEGYEIRLLKTNDIEELDALIKKLSIDMIVIDHYGIDYDFEKQLKTQNSSEQSDNPAGTRRKLKIFSLDDTYEKHCCDILLNHNIYADAKKYKGLVPDHCELRCGEEYTLLRDEFKVEKGKPKKLNTQHSTPNIFIAMGGSDIANFNPKILRALERFDGIHVDMVTTTANSHLEELQKLAQDKLWITLHINSTEIAKLLAMSDLAIVTPSVTMNEVWYMKIPFIAIQVAENQSLMSEFLVEKGNDVLREFSEQKVYRLVLSHLQTGTALINFTDLTLEEKTRILTWRNHDNIRKWMYNKDLISLEDHLSYIESLKDRNDRAYFLVRERENEIGVIDFTSIDPERASAEIGLYAKPGSKGVGGVLMRKLINYGFDHLHLKTLLSNVYVNNMRAMGLYKKFGFIETARDEELVYMELKREDR